MKILCVFLCAAFFWNAAVCLAEGESYREQARKIFDAADGLNDIVKTNAVDLAAYDKWYKDFSALFTEFKKSFSNTHKQDESFGLIREAADGLASAWSQLKQAQYSDDQYKESITLNNVGDAHKWKSSAIVQRKEALEVITKAVESISSAEGLLEDEED